MANRFTVAQWGIAAAAVVIFLGAGSAWAAPDHYLCYKGAYAKGETKLAKPFPAYRLKDQIEDLVYDGKMPRWHCNPATKIHKGTTYAPSNPDIHLEGYVIAYSKAITQDKEAKPRSAFVQDQFGNVPLILKRPESVEVRASKTELGAFPLVACPANPCPVGTTCLASAGVCVTDTGFPAAPPFPNAAADNYKCYKVGLQPKNKFTKIVNAVQAQDQFGGKCTAGDALKLGTYCTSNAACGAGGVCGPIGYDIIKPTRLCLPVDKNGEDPGAETHTDSLMCYKIALSSVKPAKPPKFPKFMVADSNGNFPDNRLNVTSLQELCVPATAKIYFCGDGVLDQPFEDCDTPNLPSEQCVTTADPKSSICSKTCQCPIVAGCYDYHVSDFALNIAADAPSVGGSLNLNLGSTDTGNNPTTLTMCTGAADSAGRRAVYMDKDSWFFDAVAIPSSAALPYDLTVRLCADDNATGTIFTTATAASYPGLVCVAGDPAKQLSNCSTNSECDGPTPATGNGICATRDVDYTGVTDNSGTVYTQGDGKKDAAGAALMGTILRTDVFFGNGVCVGTGSLVGDCVNDCYSCDDVTPAPPGRLGVTSCVTLLGFSLPLPLRLTTGTSENTVSQAGNALDGSEVSGHGYAVTGRSLRLGASNAKLNIPTGILGTVHVQFFASESFAPVP